MSSPYKPQKILVIRRNRMGDMICTLPLLRALREKFPDAFIKVACEAKGAPIARACGAVNEVYLLKKGINRLHTLLLNLRALRGCDLAIGVKAGFDRHLAAMVRWSGARYRIGYAPRDRAFYYNHRLSLPPSEESQIESCMRLLEPLGIKQAAQDLHLDLPSSALEFSERLAAEKGFSNRFVTVFNLSSNRDHWPSEYFVELGRLLLEKTGGLIGLSCLSEDRHLADEIMKNLRSNDVFMFQSSSPLELAALFQRSHLLITPEGGSAHLAAAAGISTLVLWPRYSPLEKWKSDSDRHLNLRGSGALETISVEEVWKSVQLKFLPES